MDIYTAFLEGEAINVGFLNKTEADPTGKISAEHDFDTLVRKGLMSDDEWVTKHIDPKETFGFGYWDFVDTGDLSLRKSIERDVMNGSDAKVSAQIHSAIRGLDANGKLTNDLMRFQQFEASGLSKAERKQLIDLLVQAQTERIKQLAVKNVLSMMSAYGSPPIVKQADGTIGYLPSRTADELYDDWMTESSKITDARSKAERNGIIYDNLSPDAQAAYRQSHGEPFKAARTHEIDSLARLRETVAFESQSKDLASQVTGEAIEGLHFADKVKGGIMHHLKIHPTEHMNAMLGIPALREYAFRSEGMSAVHARNFDEGRGLIAPEYLNTEHGVNLAALPRQGLSEIDASSLRGMKTELADKVIQNRLEKHAKDYGLDPSDEISVYRHLVSVDNFSRLTKDIEDAIRPYTKTGAKIPEHVLKQIANKKANFVRAMTEVEADIDTFLRKSWDSNELLPSGSNVSRIRYEQKQGTIGSLVRSARRQFGDDPSQPSETAASRTNIELTLRDSAKTIETMGGVDTPVQGVKPDFTGGKAGRFARPTEIDPETGNYITFKDMMLNRNTPVNAIHNLDVTQVRLTAGFEAGESLLKGLNRNAVTLEELNTLKIIDPILGQAGNTYFIDPTSGFTVIDENIVGRNIRRQFARQEAEWVLQNSRNRYIGEQMEISAAAGGAPVVRRQSDFSLMDDRLAARNKRNCYENGRRAATSYRLSVS